MKDKKNIIILVLLIVGVVFLYENTYAANQDYICYVDQVGTKGGTQTRVMLTDDGGAFTQKWFLCRDNRKKEMLAILLTALTSNLQVQIRTDLDSASVPEIKNLFIVGP